MTVNNYLFFDSASTTKCCEAAIQLIQQYGIEDFGNPSSAHVYGHRAARAIREARAYFGKIFNVQPEQVIFTGSGTEANNLAVMGVCTDAVARGRKQVRILASAVEHPSVRKAME